MADADAPDAPDADAPDADEGYAAVNKDLWTRINAEYTDDQALRSWAAEDISWGVFTCQKPS